MRGSENLNTSQSIAFWALWTFTAFLAGVLLLIIYLGSVESITASADLPPKSKETRQYNQPRSCPDNQQCVQIEAIKNNDDGKKNTDKNSECEEECNSSNVVSNFIKEKRDLNAQEGMWRAALHLVQLTFVQVIVGALTMGFLVWNVALQRKELSAANRAADAAEKAERAHVFLEVKTTFCGDDNVPPDTIINKRRIRIEVGFRNYGKTPAIDVHWNIERDTFDGWRRYGASVDVIGASEFFQIEVFEEATANFFTLGDWDGAWAKNLGLKGRVDYADIINPTRTKVHFDRGSVWFHEQGANRFKPITDISDLSAMNTLDIAADARLTSVTRPYFRADQKIERYD